MIFHHVMHIQTKTYDNTVATSPISEPPFSVIIGIVVSFDAHFVMLIIAVSCWDAAAAAALFRRLRFLPGRLHRQPTGKAKWCVIIFTTISYTVRYIVM